MVDLSGSARRLLRRVTRGSGKAGEAHPGVATAVSGQGAVALTEAWISEATALGASYPAAGALWTFLEPGSSEPVNLWGRPRSVLEASGPRGGLAGGMGMVLAGMRVTAFLSGEDVTGSLDLVAQAVRRRIPLIVQLAAGVRHTQGAAGAGHEPLHAVGETGALVLVAATVQEAVDFTLIARRLAEDALAPVVVAMDGEETALGVEDVLLPEAGVLRSFVGDPDQSVHAHVPSQELVFGKHRRRVPRWHDPERPFLTGPSAGAVDFALAEAGRYAYLESHAAPLLEAALTGFHRETGRLHAPVSEYRLGDADLVLVGMGSVVATLEEAADRLRREGKIKAGVLGIRVLRPFPAARITELLRGGKTVAVLERVSPHAESETPLVRDIRAALEQARSETPSGGASRRSREKDVPRLASVFYGLGGAPVRSGDLMALGAQLAGGFRSPLFLGMAFDSAGSDYPKRQVLLDVLKRHYPEAGALGLIGNGSGVSPAEGVVTVAVHRMTGRGGDGLAGEAAGLAHRLGAAHVASRPAVVWDRWGRAVADRFLFGREPVRDPGEDMLARVTVWVGDGLVPPETLGRRAVEGGAVLIVRDPATRSFWESLPAAFRRDVVERGLKLYTVTRTESDQGREAGDRMLGAVLGVLQKEGHLEVTLRKLAAAARDLLPDGDPAGIEARVAAIQSGFDLVAAVETQGLRAPAPAAPAEVEAPRVVRRLRRIDEAADSLSRFWDQVGVLVRRGEAESLVPDPYLGAGILPPLSSAFRDLSPAREMFPAFDPSLCTGCGDCWSACPDSAMTPMVIGAASLLESGMALARERGTNADALRMAVSKLAARVGETMADPPAERTAGAVLDGAFEKLMVKPPFPETKRQGIADAFGAVREAVAPLPVARTPYFFDQPEAEKKGSGELFALAVSPDACKGCGVCVAACDVHALTSRPEDAARSREARALWELFEALPDPEPATLERARNHPEVGPVAAAMLTREVRESFAGGDGAEPGSGEKIALRELLALVYARSMTEERALRSQVEALRDRLGDAIRDRMAQALPTGDLAALSKGLRAVERADVNLAELSDRIEGAFDSGRVDVPELRRLVESAREVSDLLWRLAEGEGGLGRTPFGLVMAGGSAAAWASSFPDNPFGVPVVVDGSDETLELARGILEGHLQSAARDAGVLRRGELELEDPKEAARSGASLSRLGWRDLTAEERRRVPPVWVVLGEDALGRDRDGLAMLLAGDLPVKVVVLSELDLGLGTRRGPAGAGDMVNAAPELDLLGLAGTGAFLAQTAVSAPEHLDRSVAGTLDHDGPALVRMAAPSPERHGFPRDLTVSRVRDAVRSRVFPLVILQPVDSGTEATTRVDLDGNPEPEALWPGESADAARTPADWALGERRFEAQFGAVAEGTTPAPLAVYLALEPEDRKGKAPVVTGEDGVPRAVAPGLVRAAALRGARWRALVAAAAASAPAGAPGVEMVEASALEALRSQQAAELETVRQEEAARSRAEEAAVRLEMARKVRTRLLTLLQRPPEGNGGAAGEEPETANEESPA